MNEILRILRAGGYALDGLVFLLKKERNTKILLVVTLLTLIICPLIGFTTIQTMIVFITTVVTVIAEVLNTAIEITLDLQVEGKFHPKVKIAKDIAACTVLFGLLTSLTTAVVFFISNMGSR